jgi:hypothetical protein
MQDFDCGQMSVSGCNGHYEFVLSAGAKAKSVTNNLPLLSVLAFRFNVRTNFYSFFCFFDLSGCILVRVITDSSDIQVAFPVNNFLFFTVNLIVTSTAGLKINVRVSFLKLINEELSVLI